MIEHWNGTSWEVVPSPNGGSALNVFEAVAVVAPNDVWAVGYTQNTGGPTQTLVEHWNGTAWAIVPSPNPGSAELGLNDSHAITGRLGFLANPGTLIYGLFGYMWQKYDAHFTADSTGFGSATAS